MLSGSGQGHSLLLFCKIPKSFHWNSKSNEGQLGEKIGYFLNRIWSQICEVLLEDVQTQEISQLQKEMDVSPFNFPLFEKLALGMMLV